MTDISIEQFRSDARTFLAAHCPLRDEDRVLAWGEGSDDASLFEERSPEEAAATVREAMAWRQTMFDAGFAWITGPTQYGGRALPGSYQRAYDEVAMEFDTPILTVFGIGLGMVAPTILAHGTDVTKDRYLRAMYRGDIIGCQLFSEPGAGSDLASLQTKAERDGDEWVITGQKVWTTNAQHADIGEIICRTDPNQPKHKGLTGFVVNMKAPGVEVRPLRQMTGGAEFNEVFFNEVRVPDDHRLGDVNQGWTVALTTLMNERASIGGGGGSRRTDMTGTVRLAQLLHAMGKDQDRVLRQELMDIYVNRRVAQMTAQRAMAKIRAGQLPGPEMSTGKLAVTQNMMRTSAFVSKVVGAKLMADGGEWGTFNWSAYVLGTPGMRIAGGSDEVMRNILGERVLGLPKDVGIDSVTPFKELKVGTQQL